MTIGVQLMNIGYMRVSSKDQTTARQLEGIELDEVFEDKVSGVVRERPQLDICLKACRKGDTLHIHSVDRLARSLRDVLEILELLMAKGVTVIFHTERLTFSSDTDNPYHTFMLQLLGSVAQLERTISKGRQKEGIAQAKAKGTRSGKPFGKQPLDPSLKPKAIALFNEGMNITLIAQTLKVSRGSVYNLLSGQTKTVTY
jgi:DNA invertase Pin-like site-specific DNA recombinase